MNHDALVVFHPWGDCLVSKLCHPQFRHCFVILLFDDFWTLFEYTKDSLTVRTLLYHDGQSAEQVADYYRQRKCHVSITRTRKEPGDFQPCWFSCVELAKRQLGIKRWWIWTPRQLWRYLEHESRRTAL